MWHAARMDPIPSETSFRRAARPYSRESYVLGSKPAFYILLHAWERSRTSCQHVIRASPAAAAAIESSHTAHLAGFALRVVVRHPWAGVAGQVRVLLLLLRLP